ncbi:DUF3987 domain-containing protein [Streptomyces sp. NPDC091280]|uniref:DUF3987 domain-containing protein n=1 Tax=Streptomyces sp. NPDC091280 TaxID=3365984 RepID=UPI0038178238
MSTFEEMKYGPLGKAVEAAMPTSEADPIGVWAASLSLYSSAISRSVRLESGRPVVVWTVLAGLSSRGAKGTALRTSRGILSPLIGGYLDGRAEKGVASGPALVSWLAKYELDTKGTEGGMDGRGLLIEDEWSESLAQQKRCPKFASVFRTAWDGQPISNRTKKEGLTVVTRPLLGFHGHITPGEWKTSVTSSKALGGSFNRLLPVLVEQSKKLPFDQKPVYPAVPALKENYRWAISEERVISFTAEAGRYWDQLRDIIDERLAGMPELLASYMERSAEQVYRVAAVLTASEKRTRISLKAVKAAWAFVSYSMTSVEKLVRDAADQSTKAMKTTEELVRDVLARYGGEASSTILLRALGTRINAAALKEAVVKMDDVQVEKLNTPGRGAKPIMYRLITPEAEKVTEESRKPLQVETETAPVLRIVESEAVRPRKARKRPKRQVAIPTEPVAVTNPILSLL